MRRALGISLVIGLLAVAGCDSDKQPGGAPAAPPSTSATPPATTAPDGPAGAEPPVLPDLARQKSAAGAKAFVRYYVDLLNYSVAHNSTAGMDAAHASGCGICRRFIGSIRTLERNGGAQTGGQWTIRRAEVLGGRKQPVVVCRLRIGVGHIVDREGASPRKIRPHPATFQFILTYRPASGWRVRDVMDV